MLLSKLCGSSPMHIVYAATHTKTITKDGGLTLIANECSLPTSDMLFTSQQFIHRQKIIK